MSKYSIDRVKIKTKTGAIENLAGALVVVSPGEASCIFLSTCFN